MTSPSRARVTWPVAAIAVGTAVVVGLVVRWLLLPAEGVKGDIDVFVLWTHGIAVDGLGRAYDQNITFLPVMPYIWAVLAAIEPAFKVVSDSSDEGIRILMKLPATLADLGIAAVVGYSLRERPGWAAVGIAAVLLVPAIFDVSAWWGQYESIYTLSALAAALCAVRGHNGVAAALVAVSLMTKPQAVPFLIPFAAWFWATGGLKGLIRAALIGAAVIVVLWLPFIPAGGPQNYLRNFGVYQGEIFNVLSLRAWNAWWLVQTAFAGGHFVADNVPFLGPVTLRWVGYAATAVLQLVIAVAILRDPRPRTLFLGLAASTLVVFCFLTAMHERYAYAALPFLLLLLPEPRVRWLVVALAVVFTLNLLAALPPTEAIGALVPIDGLMGVLGSIAMLAITAMTLVTMRDRRRPDQSAEPDQSVDVALNRRLDDAQAISGASISGTVVRL